MPASQCMAVEVQDGIHRLRVTAIRCSRWWFLPRPETPEDLLHHACLFHRWPSTRKLERWVFSRDGVELDLEPPVSMVASTMEPLIDRAEQDLGLIYTPTFTVRRCRRSTSPQSTTGFPHRTCRQPFSSSPTSMSRRTRSRHRHTNGADIRRRRLDASANRVARDLLAYGRKGGCDLSHAQASAAHHSVTRPMVQMSPRSLARSRRVPVTRDRHPGPRVPMKSAICNSKGSLTPPHGDA